MEEEIIKNVLSVLSVLSNEDLEGDRALPVEKGQVAVSISKNNFHSIDNSTGSVTFIDGGNAELFGAANFSLQFVRVGAITYPEKKRTKEEFYLLITFKNDKFFVKTFPNVLELEFDSLDPRIRTGTQRILANRIGGICRRLTELKLSSKFNNVVIDGDLTAHNKYEEELIKNLKNVFGVSKTSNIITEKGRVLNAVLFSLKQGSWYYGNVYENSNIVFAKFHDKAKHVFRIDMIEKKLDILGILKKMSNDPVFLGYPYGLIEVDRYARISNKETEFLRTKFMTKFGKEWGNVKTYLRTKDAHAILDSVG